MALGLRSLRPKGLKLKGLDPNCLYASSVNKLVSSFQDLQRCEGARPPRPYIRERNGRILNTTGTAS